MAYAVKKHHAHLILGILLGMLTAATLYGLAYENARITNIENWIQAVSAGR